MNVITLAVISLIPNQLFFQANQSAVTAATIKVIHPIKGNNAVTAPMIAGIAAVNALTHTCNSTINS